MNVDYSTMWKYGNTLVAQNRLDVRNTEGPVIAVLLLNPIENVNTSAYVEPVRT